MNKIGNGQTKKELKARVSELEEKVAFYQSLARGAFETAIYNNERFELLARFLRGRAKITMNHFSRSLEWIVTFAVTSLKAHSSNEDPVESVILYEHNRELKSKK